MAKIEGSKRQVIREAILSHPKGVFTAPEILAEVQKSFPKSVKQDIYLVTSEFKNKGILEKIDTTSGKDSMFKVVARPMVAKTAAAVRELPRKETAVPVNQELVDWGEALFAYVESLKDRIRKAAELISNEQQKQKDMDIRHHQIMTEKEKTIQELKDQIATLNRRLVERNRENYKAGFKMEEIAHFKKS